MIQEQMLQEAFHELIRQDHYVPIEVVEKALTAALSSQWIPDPMKTAPKDGDTNILIGCFGEHSHGEQRVVFYDEEDGSKDWPWRTADGIGYHKDLPTHWQPLPPPPTPEEKTGE